MAQLTVNLSKRLLHKLHVLRESQNESYPDGEVSLSDVVEEAIMGHYNISLSDLAYENQMNISGGYYVYVILDPTVKRVGSYEGFTFNHIPVYVGKGQGKRAESHLSQTQNKGLQERIDMIRSIGEEPIVKIIRKELYGNQALSLENNLIFSIGRRDRDEGSLFNLTGGLKYQEEDEMGNFMDLETSKMKQILYALNESKNIKQAASRLGISERTLFRKMKTYKFEKDKRTGLYFSS